MNVQQEVAAISHRLTQELTVEEVIQQLDQLFSTLKKAENDDEVYAVLSIKDHLFDAYTDAMKRENGEQETLPPAVSEVHAAKDAEILKLKIQLKEARSREKNHKVVNKFLEENLVRKNDSVKAAEAENASLKKELAELKIQLEMAKLGGKYEKQSRMLAGAKKELEVKNQLLAKLSKK